MTLNLSWYKQELIYQITKCTYMKKTELLIITRIDNHFSLFINFFFVSLLTCICDICWYHSALLLSIPLLCFALRFFLHLDGSYFSTVLILSCGISTALLIIYIKLFFLDLDTFIFRTWSLQIRRNRHYCSISLIII